MPKPRPPLPVSHLVRTDDARFALWPISWIRRSLLVLERPAHHPGADSHAGHRGFAAGATGVPRGTSASLCSRLDRA